MYEEVTRICVGSFCRFVGKAAEEYVPDGSVMSTLDLLEGSSIRP